ncbi:MAG: hypothetical protein OJF51_000565 [Nitrospira sp.]|nr:MAG: hypothetical protein OJF51_000565 [Nitrospira sp.]
MSRWPCQTVVTSSWYGPCEIYRWRMSTTVFAGAAISLFSSS